MNKEKALKNQGLEFREDISFPGGGFKGYRKAGFLFLRNGFAAAA